MSLYRNVTIWPLVQGSAGEKVVSEVPSVMPFDTAQRTASLKYSPAATSLNGFLLPAAGVPSARCRNVTTCARVQGSLGENVVAEVPSVMPFSTAHRTAL